MSDRSAEPGQIDKSPACTREEHGDCAHLVALGGGFNPRRLRLEAGAGLCPCSCHSSCPAAPSGKRMTVPLRTWRDSCTCPGAEQARRRMVQNGADLRDFGERRDDARSRTRARREAFQAAQARAAGKDRAEIREIYLAELNARDLPVPKEAVLDLAVDNISGKPFPTARSLLVMGKEIREISRRRP